MFLILLNPPDLAESLVTGVSIVSFYRPWETQGDVTPDPGLQGACVPHVGLWTTDSQRKPGTSDQPSGTDRPRGRVKSRGDAPGTHQHQGPTSTMGKSVVELSLNWICHELAPVFSSVTFSVSASAEIFPATEMEQGDGREFVCRTAPGTNKDAVPHVRQRFTCIDADLLLQEKKKKPYCMIKANKNRKQMTL